MVLNCVLTDDNYLRFNISGEMKHETIKFSLKLKNVSVFYLFRKTYVAVAGDRVPSNCLKESL